MLKKGFRITKKVDFDRVFRSGKPLFFEEIGCRISQNAIAGLRVGFSLSKKSLPLAVDRNHLRRVISEAFTSLRSEWPSGIDIVFFAKKQPKHMDYYTSLSIVSRIIKYIHKQKD
jgi:ribonuclease P protein component